MSVRAHVMFTSDARGRLLRCREPSGAPAPRFYLGRSRLGNIWRFRADLPAHAVRELARLAGKEGPLPDPPVAAERHEAMRRILAEARPVEREWRGPAFLVPDVSHPAAGGPEPLLLTEQNVELVGDSFSWLRDELAERHPCAAIFERGRAVCVCFSARRGSEGHAEAGVDTLEGHRGRGHAPRAVATWAAALRAAGGTAFYSTSWDNRASRRVAEKLGLIFCGEDCHFT